MHRRQCSASATVSPRHQLAGCGSALTHLWRASSNACVKELGRTSRCRNSDSHHEQAEEAEEAEVKLADAWSENRRGDCTRHGGSVLRFRRSGKSRWLQDASPGGCRMRACSYRTRAYGYGTRACGYKEVVSNGPETIRLVQKQRCSKACARKRSSLSWWLAGAAATECWSSARGLHLLHASLMEDLAMREARSLPQTIHGGCESPPEAIALHVIWSNTPSMTVHRKIGIRRAVDFEVLIDFHSGRMCSNWIELGPIGLSWIKLARLGPKSIQLDPIRTRHYYD